MKLPAPHRLTLALISILGLNSCSLPNAEGWKIIRTQGLVAYWGRSSPNATPQRSRYLADPWQPSVAQPQRAAVAERPRSVAVVPPKLPVEKPMVAQQSAPKPAAAPVTKPKPAPVLNNQTAGVPRRELPVKKQAPAKKKTVETAKREEPKKPAPDKSLAAAAPVKKIQPPAPAPEAKPKPPVAPVAPALPFGSIISGRPGFVNSPFAAPHQLVDVSGLAPGQEVKCPYSGKLFRVPNGNAGASPQ
jgi:hypothetical protein